MKSEAKFQSELIHELHDILGECYVLKIDAYQGLPDILVLYKDKWATLECKKHENASIQANQEYHVGHMDEMSFSRFIFPGNKEEVLNELCEAFGVDR